MGIDGNFAGGFAQGTQPIVQGLRQDRRDAASRAFKEKLIKEDRTAQANIRQENQKIQSKKQFTNALFQLQDRKRKESQFRIEQGVGRQFNASLLSQQAKQKRADALSRGFNSVLEKQKKQASARAKVWAQNLAPTSAQTAAYDAETNRIFEQDQAMGRSMLQGINDAKADLLSGKKRHEDLEAQFRDIQTREGDSNSLRATMSSTGGQALKSAFNLEEGDITEIFGEVGEPTTQQGRSFFASPTENLEPERDTPEQALEKRRVAFEQRRKAEAVSTGSGGAAISTVSSLEHGENEQENSAINDAFRTAGAKIDSVIATPSDQKLDQDGIHALTTLFKKANDASEEDLANFALSQQEGKPITSGGVFNLKKASDSLESGAFKSREVALKKRIAKESKEANTRIKKGEVLDSYRPNEKDSLRDALLKLSLWKHAGRPMKKRNSRGRITSESSSSHKDESKDVMEKRFLEAIADKTDGKQSRDLLDAIETFRQRQLPK